MGHTIASVRLYNPRDPSKCLELELLVDTGSTYTWIKRGRLEKLGIKPMSRRRFRLLRVRLLSVMLGKLLLSV